MPMRMQLTLTAWQVEKARGILDEIKQHMEPSPKVATSRGAAAQAKAVNEKQVWDQVCYLAAAAQMYPYTHVHWH